MHTQPNLSLESCTAIAGGWAINDHFSPVVTVTCLSRNSVGRMKWRGLPQQKSGIPISLVLTPYNITKILTWI